MIGGFVVVRRTAGVPARYEWRLSDGLGSVDALVNGAPGSTSFPLRQRMSFDAFGLRRDAYSGTWETLAATATLGGTESNVTLRGYTGHEQVDPVGMIHMNGRLYDPRIGRFVQADPVVDDGLDAQAYNRYSYVTNNPLRYTDPSGFRRSGQARSAGVALFALIVFNIAAPGSMPPWLWASLQGATVGAVGTGSSSGAAWGAVSALAFYGIGQVVQGPEVGTPFREMVTDGAYWSKVSAHAAAGGILTDLQGGKFGHGFVTAGVSAGASPLIDTIDGGRATGRPARIVVQALVGGVVSKGMGGDFGSGALLAAIGRVMNAESGLALREAFDDLTTALRPLRRGKMDEIAAAFCDEGACAFTEKHGVEIGANIYQAGSAGYRLDAFRLGDAFGVDLDPDIYAAGDVHTHPIGAKNGMSGWVQRVWDPRQQASVIKHSGAADIALNWVRNRPGYVARGGDRALWIFDYHAAQKASASPTFSGQDFVRRIR